MFESKVYRIMIGCPSDIKEEVDIAREYIHKWSDMNAETFSVALLPMHWELNSYPAHGSHPQKILDKQLVEKSDLLICIFNSKIGTPTDTSVSGTIEEIEEHIKAGKQVMIFFKKEVDITNISPVELQNLNDFRERIKGSALWWEYDNSKVFGNVLTDKLQLFLNDNWLKTTGSSANTQEYQKTIEYSLSEEEVNRLRKWTEASSPDFFCAYFSGGSAIFGLGASNQYEVSAGREMAQWESFFDKLIDYGFIGIKKYDKYGHPIYQLKLEAYQYIEALDDNNHSSSDDRIIRHKQPFITLKDDANEIIYCSRCWDVNHKLVQVRCNEHGWFNCVECENTGIFDQKKADAYEKKQDDEMRALFNKPSNPWQI